MKKLFLISILTVFATACSNKQADAQEEQKRDSIDNVQVDANQRFVDSLEKADEAARKAAEAQHKDSGDHSGHDHGGHDHEGHSH